MTERYHVLVDPKTGHESKEVEVIFVAGYFAVAHDLRYNSETNLWGTTDKCFVFHIPSGVTMASAINVEVARELASCLMRILLLGEYLHHEASGYIQMRYRIDKTLIASSSYEKLKKAFWDPETVDFIKLVGSGAFENRKALLACFDKAFPEVKKKQADLKSSSCLVFI